MKLPSIANDDHPGPIFRRHNSTGGDFRQSVSICRPRTTLSRFGPRKPGQIAGRAAAAAGFSLAGAGVGADAGFAGAAVVSGAGAGAAGNGVAAGGATGGGAGDAVAGGAGAGACRSTSLAAAASSR